MRLFMIVMDNLVLSWRFKMNNWVTYFFEAIKNDKVNLFPAALIRLRDVNTFNLDTDQTGLMTAAYLDSLKCLNELIRLGADINLKNKSGKTAIYFAAHWDNDQAVKFLLLAGADHTIKSNDGLSALDVAIKNKSEKTSKLISEFSQAMNEKSSLDQIIKSSENNIELLF